jgi:hypothetical protein
VSQHSLEFLIAEVEKLPYADLKARYQAIFNCPSPPRLGQNLLRRAITYRMQADVLGGLPKKAEKLLRTDSPPAARNAHQRLIRGTQLVREWQGEMHVVEILEDGFLWKERHFASLSAVAREIAGTRWSGPRFFGLTGPCKQ